MNAFYADIHDTINRCGHKLLAVAANPPFVYTIGLHEQVGFELLCVGLSVSSPRALMYTEIMMNMIAASIKDIKLGVPTDEFTNHPIILQRCTVDTHKLHDDYVIQADRYYDTKVDVVQIVLADRNGVLPGQPLFDDEYMRPRQPLFCKL